MSKENAIVKNLHTTSLCIVNALGFVFAQSMCPSVWQVWEISSCKEENCIRNVAKIDLYQKNKYNVNNTKSIKKYYFLRWEMNLEKLANYAMLHTKVKQQRILSGNTNVGLL